MSRFVKLALCAAMVATLALPAMATTAVHLSDEALVAGSDLILVGETTAVSSTWVGRDLVTIATVQVRDSLKGGVGTTVDVVLPGGVDTSGAFPVSVTWPGAPTLTQGEQAVLFLNRYGAVDGGFAIAGWSQGKFSVVDSADGAEVRRDLSELTLATGESRKRGKARNEKLNDFVGKIRGLVAEEVSR